MLVYDDRDGYILGIIPKSQDPKVYYANYDADIIENLKVLDIVQEDELDTTNLKLNQYRIINSKLVKMSNSEIEEIQNYGKILTEEERLEKKTLESLLPSQLELEQAELMIKLLPILKEVMGNE